MELCPYRSSSTIKKISKKASPVTDSRNRQMNFAGSASDEYWAATFVEEVNGKRNICVYKSGAFKLSELHYHSTFKEILAVKHGIEKF